MEDCISVHDGGVGSEKPGVTISGYALDHLSNDELLAGTRRLVGRSNQVLARLLAHLAEVETRGIHRERACASLYTYCVYELRMSEDAASRRVRAARIVRRVPEALEAVARGELHLTGLLLLGPLLTEANSPEVLARAKHRTKREIERLVRELDPLPDVPPVVEPLGPGRPGAGLRRATWSQVVASFHPVRELEPGDRPSNWMDESLEAGAEEELGELERCEADSAPSDAGDPDEANAQPRPPQRYKIQFTASERYVELLRRAGDLLSHTEPAAPLESVHLRALELLVERLEKKKYGVTTAPTATRPESKERTRVPRQSGSTDEREARDGDAHATDGAAQRDGATHAGNRQAQRDGDAHAGNRQAQRDGAASRESKERTRVPLQRGSGARERATKGRTGASAASTRHVPAAVRCAVWQRDAGRCSYVDARGQRCRETAFLELHHVEPHARGGPATEANITLRCHAHNALAAEQDFGREVIASKRPRW